MTRDEMFLEITARCGASEHIDEFKFSVAPFQKEFGMSNEDWNCQVLDWWNEHWSDYI